MARFATVLALAAVLAAGCGSGGKPHFESAAGWHLLSRHGELAAAKVVYAPADRSLVLTSPPSRTVASLPRDGTVIWAMYVRGGNSHYRRRRLPLRVEQGAPSNPFEGFRCAPAVTTSHCFAASGSVWRVFGRYASYDLDVYVFFGTDRPLPSDIAAADAELARLRFPHRPTRSAAPQSANCPRPAGTGFYDSTVRPASGPAGSTVIVSGRLPIDSESGQDVGQNSTEVTAYWNLDLDHWTTISSAKPVGAVKDSPVSFGGTQYVAGKCTYHVRVTVPAVSPGSYPIEVLYGDVHGAASFAPAEFRVTKR